MGRFPIQVSFKAGLTVIIVYIFQARERAARGEPEPVKKTPGTARRGRPPKAKPSGEGAPDTATDDSQVRETKPSYCSEFTLVPEPSNIAMAQITVCCNDHHVGFRSVPEL